MRGLGDDISPVTITPQATDPLAGLNILPTTMPYPSYTPSAPDNSPPVDFGSLANAIQAGVGAYQQVALTQANIKLAEQGQPPINPNAVIPAYAGTAPGTGFSATIGTSGIPVWLLIGGLLIGAVVLADRK